MLNKLIAEKLSKNEIDEIVQNKLNYILEHSNPLQIYLFGSAARQTMTTSSDVDLILIFQNETDMRHAQQNLAKNRSQSLWPQDLIFHTEESFHHSVSKGGGASWLAFQEGQLIYSRGLK
jgi:predicted nucleotidyltransferase